MADLTSIERLNVDCTCVTLDVAKLCAALEAVAGDGSFCRELVQSHPNLMSAQSVFLSEIHAERMRSLIAAVETVATYPAYQAAVLSYAPDIAHFRPEAAGVFMGYDFHLGSGGPKLIEINTNAGGGLINAYLTQAQRVCCVEMGIDAHEQLNAVGLPDTFVDCFRTEWHAEKRMERVDTLVVDKTGTLTEGKPSVVAIKCAPGVNEDELLRLTASLEGQSEHPLAAAIVRLAKDRNVPRASVDNFDAPIGKGVTGLVGGHKLVIGNRKIMNDAGITTQVLEQQAEELRREGATAIFVAIDDKLAGILGIADPIKATTSSAITALTGSGVRVVMLTGDNSTTAQAVAQKLGITEVEADVLPQDKSKVVERLRAQGRVVAMAGDGVNDAPALAAADVGLAMGTGTDVAMESAGVTLLKGDLNGIARARHLSAATMANIRQNLFFAFIYNAAGIPIAAGVLYPHFGLLLSPMIAAAAMALSSVSVIGNALRLNQLKL